MINNLYKPYFIGIIAFSPRVSGKAALRFFIVAIFTIILIITFNQKGSAQAWFSTSWNYRKAITIDFNKVPNTDQGNFPVLVSLTADAGLSAHALASGNDILFTLSDGTTQIPYQRESYSGGTLTAWVKATTLSHTANTVIYMYYGNPGSADQQQAATVWDASYTGVYHLSEPGAGAVGEYKESKSGTVNGTVTDPVIKAVYNIAASANSFCYQELTNPANYTIAPGDVLVYDVYWTSSTDLIAFDFTCSDNSTLRDNGATDQNGVGAHPATDLSARALNKWYHRIIPIPAILNGKIISNYDIACEFDGAATKTGYINNIYILNTASGISRVIYTEGGNTTNAVHINSPGSTVTSMANAPDPTARSVTGKMSNAVNTDASRFLNMSGSVTNVVNNFTLEAWVNPNVLSQHGYFIYNGNNGVLNTNGGYGIGIGDGAGNSGNKLIGLYGANGWVPSGFTFPAAGAWYHVVLERSGGTTSFFVNGAPFSATGNSSLAPSTPNNFLTIGNELDATSRAYRYFNGPIDEVRISTTPRSSDWIATEYNNQSSPSTFYTVGAEIILAPTITGFTPTSGCANTTPVVITGTNFTGATSVKFGGTNALSFTVNSATQITAVPAGGSTGNISVSAPVGPTGIGTSASGFTVNSLPISSAVKTDITCFTASDGTITVTGNSGLSPYLFSIDNGTNYLPATGVNLHLFTGLTVNTPYKIRVKDDNGCESKLIQ